MKIQQGKLLAIESGEYSDFNVKGFFVALKDFDMREEISAYLDEHPEQRDEYCADQYAFLAWMLRRGNWLEIDHVQCYIGSYGCLKCAP